MHRPFFASAAIALALLTSHVPAAADQPNQVMVLGAVTTDWSNPTNTFRSR